MTVVLTCVTLAAIFDDPAKTLSDLGKGVAESASSAFQGATDVLHQTGVLQTHPPLPPVVHPPPSPHPPPKSPSPLHPPPLQPPPSSPVDRCFVARGWGAHGEGFRGSVSYTRTGRECQPWSRQYPHTHTLPAKLGTNTTLVSNYCRNPVGMGVPLQAGPWCFTTDPEVRLEVCAICDAPDALLVPVKPPNVHRPVPEWVGPFCLSFAVLVLLALVAVVLLRYSSFEWPSLNEMAFGRAVETRSMLGAGGGCVSLPPGARGFSPALLPQPRVHVAPPTATSIARSPQSFNRAAGALFQTLVQSPPALRHASSRSRLSMQRRSSNKE